MDIIGEIRFHRQLRRLCSKQREIDCSYKKLIEKARKEKPSREKIESLQAEGGFEHSMIQDEIDLLVTRRLTELARRLILPLPKYDDEEMWIPSQSCRAKVLTEQGVVEVRSTIRQELKERRDAYLPWIVVLVGLLGTITGLLAVILR